MLKAGTEAGFWGTHAAVLLFSGLESFAFNFFYLFFFLCNPQLPFPDTYEKWYSFGFKSPKTE